MSKPDETGPKVHYICQTYVAKKGVPGGLQVEKQFQYSSAAQAEERAERESQSGNYVGADAYSVTEDPASGEVGPPTFLARFGTVPENDDY